ncbi:MAG: M28 family peptidase [Gemmatimonadaceae bacterium]
MRLLRALAPLALAVRLLGAQPTPAADSVPALDSLRMLRMVAVLAADSMEGRKAGTRGGERARNVLLGEFARIGLQPLVRGHAARFNARSLVAEANPFPTPCQPLASQGRRPTCLPAKPFFPTVRGVNLLGVVRGTVHPDRYIVVSAHYDHLGFARGEVFPGADDNASGTAIVLAIAEWTVAHPPRNSIIFAFFDGEESGLLGSAEFMRKPPVPAKAIAANVNVDMVGQGLNDQLWASGARLTPALVPMLDSVRGLGPVQLLLGHDVEGSGDDFTHRSDSGPFRDHGIAIVQFGTEEGADYHRPTDTAARIHPAFYVASARMITAFVQRLDRELDVAVPDRGGAHQGPVQHPRPHSSGGF